MSPTEGRLVVRGLASRAGPFALGPIDLTVAPDRVLTVLGPSGAGKTVLLNTIAGFRRATAGELELGGRRLTGLPAEDRRIGYVFQDAALFPHLSVRENVRFALRARGQRRYEAADALLEHFAITGLAERRPRSLSGGERQRVALARALASQPELLLLDEPLSSLDQPTREELRGVLQTLLASLKIPAIHVTHDREEALSIGDEVAVIVGGHLRQRASAEEIVAAPADASVARLLGWNELGHGKVEQGTVKVGELTLPLLDEALAATGTLEVLYRPEAVLLGAGAATCGKFSFRAPLKRIVPTTPLLRVLIAGNPCLNVLLLARDLDGLRLEPGRMIDVGFPAGSLRMFATPAVSGE
jgi:ABC-type Fe3+/spermidine/putrescine transport system ATPase subunit